MDSPAWMTADEVADLLRVHVRTVRAWARAGKLRGTRMGKYWLFERAWIERQLELRTNFEPFADLRRAFRGRGKGAPEKR